MKPFITACLGGACGGFFLGLIAWMGLPVGLNTVFGPSGLVALPLMTSGSGIYAGMAVYAVGLAVSYLCGFVLTWPTLPGGGWRLTGQTETRRHVQKIFSMGRQCLPPCGG
jgi:phosphotransferase system  glucose/maltose/N-acetylglucosamine-specific IIC component